MLSEKFLEYIKYEKRLSEHTVTAYQIDLKQYYDFVKMSENFSGNDEISSLTYENIKNYLIFLKKSDL